ncbi:MAG: hypothetical protein HY293_18990, partial [Planctomycetes bacterium]|nr:hypothetical protein [Planctomycetota bacterium]
MGRAIFYCVQCSKRISDLDLEKGKAFRIGERILCSTCAPESAKNQTFKRTTAVNRKNSSTSGALRKVTAPLATPPPAPAPARRNPVLLFGAAGAVLVFIVIVAVFLFRGRVAPPAAPAPGDDAGSTTAQPPKTPAPAPGA